MKLTEELLNLLEGSPIAKATAIHLRNHGWKREPKSKRFDQAVYTHPNFPKHELHFDTVFGSIEHREPDTFILETGKVVHPVDVKSYLQKLHGVKK